MTFAVFPWPATAPLVIAAEGHSAPIELAGTIVDSAIGSGTCWVRVVKLGDGCAPAGGSPPGFRLAANDGEAIDVKRFPDATTIRTEAGVGVGDASWQPTTDDVYLVRIFTDRPNVQWHLQVVNDDPVPRSFTEVVADSDADSQQPWITVAPTLTWDGSFEGGEFRVITYANLGTGRLTITGWPGWSPGAGFEIVWASGPISPNACGAITMTAPGVGGDAITTTYRIPSNDTTALTTAGHNCEVILTVVPAGS